jgi:adenylosuccinate synthase
VCTSYTNDEGAVFEEFPYHQSILHSAKAVTEAHPGFTEDIGGCRSIADLPQNARRYLEFISEFVGVPIKVVGVGPGREQVIWADGARPLRAAA